MFIDRNNFEEWMRRIMERFDQLEKKMEKEEKPVPTIDGERMFDNQDICLLLNICKRTLQRYRTLGWLPYMRIDKKTYYTRSGCKEIH